MRAYCAPTVLRTSRFRIALPQQAACALLHHDYRNDSTASRMRSLYALHRSLSVAIPAIQPRLRLSRTNRLRSAFYGGQRLNTNNKKHSLTALDPILSLYIVPGRKLIFSENPYCRVWLYRASLSIQAL
ncbi:MAG: hypothetical protein KZQ59_12920, partial [Candidatus Thiodiazotropha sp. (ex Lucinoma aequizonata)]|nr:hypothetical protein [Candidatus Thiodiazotropha sp. (ex Lucinoma aequizonata)]MCU7896550.1 hypothetical protein [Candidatus Thiodiazotropha sp. (ex Lucinoma aequizonata)]MCU7899275.1 hypothetical protein [Candidatus Thiodiazotropha sp. (ex Lucinoma aequizonata)]MCU7908477.1 hypothetical protein [Candidatus Thiodiazotropha sp. (ex Lucinoma aequizonata)]